MKTTRKNFMMVLFVALLMITAMVFSGCGETSKAEAIEYNTPTGCLKEKARYFSPELGKCIEVTNIREASRLNSYRRIHELADENAGKIKYAVYFRKYETIEEAEKLWVEVRDQGAEMINFTGPLPDNKIYDPLQEWEFVWIKNHPITSRIWGGPDTDSYCGWIDFYDPPADTIRKMLEESLKKEEEERPRPQLRKAILQDGDCRIEMMMMTVDAKAMRDWLDRHLDKLAGAQPYTGIFDGTMPTFGPIDPIKEGE